MDKLLGAFLPNSVSNSVLELPTDKEIFAGSVASTAKQSGVAT